MNPDKQSTEQSGALGKCSASTGEVALRSCRAETANKVLFRTLNISSYSADFVKSQVKHAGLVSLEVDGRFTKKSEHSTACCAKPFGFKKF